MVAGESGLGKTTFINTLFQTSLKPHQDPNQRHNKFTTAHQTVEIDIVRAILEEKNFKIRLNIIDTPVLVIMSIIMILGSQLLILLMINMNHL